ncbi:MAG: bifunctional UDP-N-acetylglucosamine diphosphorylase/glucosamine-1-phosphate N-acetyltransferase GlmU [SAR202 cluster bacterium]|nr:bifunctional UDP-N-acetylglucosamine diphosphorylase/glucosamine-1-phosphate N-acetyltransferase GlmU [SAR202 cluster bacterium]
MDNLAAAVLAAGKGTRIKSEVPKVLHKVCGKEMIRYVVDSLKLAGIDRVVVVVSPSDHDEINTVLGDSVKYAIQEAQLGTGDALMSAQRVLGTANNIVVVNGDLPTIRASTLNAQIQHHIEQSADLTLLAAHVERPDGEGRLVLRQTDGRPDRVVEEIDADQEILGIKTVNVGVYCFQSTWLWPNLSKIRPAGEGERYLPELVKIASTNGGLTASLCLQDLSEAVGVNNRVQLATAERVLQDRIRAGWMLDGVTMPDPTTVYIDSVAKLQPDTTIRPNTHVTGSTTIGRGSVIGPNSMIHDSQIGMHCTVLASIIEESTLEDEVSVGPYSHLRAGTHLETNVHIGNYVEIKASKLGRGTKSGHFSYIGDAEIGRDVNIGAGTITANYDGKKKLRTIIGDDAFIGSDSVLVAPISVGNSASTGAGAVVTKDVPPNTRVAGVPAEPMLKGKEEKGN